MVSPVLTILYLNVVGSSVFPRPVVDHVHVTGLAVSVDFVEDTMVNVEKGSSLKSLLGADGSSSIGVISLVLIVTMSSINLIMLSLNSDGSCPSAARPPISCFSVVVVITEEEDEGNVEEELDWEVGFVGAGDSGEVDEGTLGWEEEYEVDDGGKVGEDDAASVEDTSGAPDVEEEEEYEDDVGNVSENSASYSGGTSDTEEVGKDGDDEA